MEPNNKEPTCPVRSHATENAAPRPIVAVTGASRGIGHAIVKRFYDLDWEVITLARTPFSNVCPWAEGIVKHVQVDLANEVSVREAIAKLIALIDGRGLSALINNAGISPKNAEGNRLSATATPVDTMMQVQMVNLVAPLMLIRGLIVPLQQSGGSVVNVTSIAGTRIHPFAGAAYATSKAALSALTRELAYEFDHTGVRVNAVAPGEIETSILSPGTSDIVEAQVPMKRLGTPEEVADVVAFLCSSASSYVNGSEIHIVRQ